MATRVYATSSDYATWTGTPAPADIDQALRAASLVVELEMLLTAVYATDSSGMPTAPEVVEALRDAVCAQAQYARAQGDPAGVGAGTVAGFTIGGISVQRSGAVAGQPGRSGLPSHWSPQAWQILRAVDPTKLRWPGPVSY